MTKFIKIRDARVNNLKGVDLDIPLEKLSCFFGPSGSGKTSIAFHTLYNESKRRFLNSFPTYLKFFSDRPAPVEVDEIFPVLPVFGLPQINPVVGTRSNVSDIMHLTELFQNHFYHYSKELCAEHRCEFEPFEFSKYILEFLTDDPSETYHILIKATDFLDCFEGSPFPTRSIKSVKSKQVLEFDKDHELWEVVRFKPKHLESLDLKLKPYIDKSLALFIYSKNKNKVLELNFKAGQRRCSSVDCSEVGLSSQSPLYFSPYNALGACSQCGGFGETLDYDLDKLVDLEKSVDDDGVLFLNYKRFADQKIELKNLLKKKKISTSLPIKLLKKVFWTILYDGGDEFYGFTEFFKYLEKRKYKMHVRIFLRSIQKGSLCSECEGSRLTRFTRQFFIGNKAELSLHDLMSLSIKDLLTYLLKINDHLLIQSKESVKSFKKIIEILETADSVGLGHLKLLRKAKTVSAGEYQRLLLLKYLSYEGTGALFVFDEPSLGLCRDELKALLKGFKKLIKRKNTVILVDHNEYFKKSSEFLIEMGPGAGIHGGEILYKGERKSYPFKASKNLLTPLNYNKTEIMSISGIEIYEKKFKKIDIKLNQINWIQGPSGTGKTSAIINTLAAQLYYINANKHLNMTRGTFKKLINNPSFENVIIVDSNLNRYTSRSTVGSLTGFFPVIRKHFLNNSLSKSLGLKDGHLSYNSELGQCPKCEGKGVLVVEMQFLEDISLECEDCLGKKLKSIYSNISDGEMTVHEAFSSPLSKVVDRIKLTPKFQRIYEYMKILNLDYLSFDRTINSLSGGEKQRVYLLSKLQKKLNNSIIFFENISFGLSEIELIRLCEFLQNLSKNQNTIVVIDQDKNFNNIANNRISFD